MAPRPVTPPFIGYVLCGGASRRMGVDKALVEIDGVAMARRVADALVDAGAGAVHAVGGDLDRLQRWGLGVLPDPHPGQGPLGGVVAGLAHVGRAGRAVILPCDLRSPDATAICQVVAAQAAADCDVAVPVTDGHRQWLHAAWSGRCASIVADVFGAGERSVHAVSTSLRVELLHDIPVEATADADRPEDLPFVPPGGSPSSLAGVDIPVIGISDLATRMEQGAPVFDVRQPEEYREARVPGVRLVPLDEVPDRVAEFPDDDTVYVICRSGGRSAKAVEFLRDRGIDAVNVAGGTMAWIDAGRPVDSGD